jgi:hypothetical protein
MRNRDSCFCSSCTYVTYVVVESISLALFRYYMNPRPILLEYADFGAWVKLPLRLCWSFYLYSQTPYSRCRDLYTSVRSITGADYSVAREDCVYGRLRSNSELIE